MPCATRWTRARLTYDAPAHLLDVSDLRIAFSGQRGGAWNPLFGAARRKAGAGGRVGLWENRDRVEFAGLGPRGQGAGSGRLWAFGCGCACTRHEGGLVAIARAPAARHARARHRHDFSGAHDGAEPAVDHWRANYRGFGAKTGSSPQRICASSYSIDSGCGHCEARAAV